MTPYTATDLLHSMRHAYGLPETVDETPDNTSRASRWFARFIRRPGNTARRNSA
jgi:hypothetical protein